MELHRIGRIIPRSTPIAIKAEEPGLYLLYKYEGTVPDVNKWENRFIGSFIGQDSQFGVPVNQETAVEGSILTLGRNSSGVVGFYKYNGQEIPPYRAYLTRNNIIEHNVIRFGTPFDDEETGVEEMKSEKLKVNNENEAGAWFTLDGRRLASKPTQRGVYIVGGKKMAVK